jgi:septal ring factor EnvC (AmiA/AmiB activator)
MDQSNNNMACQTPTDHLADLQKELRSMKEKFDDQVHQLAEIDKKIKKLKKEHRRVSINKTKVEERCASIENEISALEKSPIIAYEKAFGNIFDLVSEQNRDALKIQMEKIKKLTTESGSSLFSAIKVPENNKIDDLQKSTKSNQPLGDAKVSRGKKKLSLSHSDHQHPKKKRKVQESSSEDSVSD